MKVFKTVDFQVLEKADNGGRILISNASFDRDSDRVFPMGAQLDNYLRNPVVQWGHSYSEPWQTVGKTTAIEITNDGIVASFELRPAANDQDPQNIVKLLWDGGWVRTASIGFIPKGAQPNQAGGNDFTSWELLEWSLVPIPANQDALRMSMKALDSQPEMRISFGESPYVISNTSTKLFEAPELKRGRVLSSKNESQLRSAYDSIGAVLAQIAQEPEQNAPEQEPEVKDIDITPDDEQVLAAELGAMLKAVKTLF